MEFELTMTRARGLPWPGRGTVCAFHLEGEDSYARKANHGGHGEPPAAAALAFSPTLMAQAAATGRSSDHHAPRGLIIHDQDPLP
jgi:hypothetical protein